MKQQNILFCWSFCEENGEKLYVSCCERTAGRVPARMTYSLLSTLTADSFLEKGDPLALIPQ